MDVSEITELRDMGYSPEEIARKGNMNFSFVLRVLNDDKYKDAIMGIEQMGQEIASYNGDYSVYDISKIMGIPESRVLEIARTCGVEINRVPQHTDRYAPVFVHSEKMTEREFAEFMLGDDEVLKRTKKRGKALDHEEKPDGYEKYVAFLSRYKGVVRSRLDMSIDPDKSLIYIDNYNRHFYPSDLLEIIRPYCQTICDARKKMDGLYSRASEIRFIKDDLLGEKRKSAIADLKKIRKDCRELHEKIEDAYKYIAKESQKYAEAKK